jgi:hypothetical protein
MDVPTPPEETYAAIHIEPYDYDFGEVDVNCEYEYDVVITSIGTEPLIIDSLDYTAHTRVRTGWGLQVSYLLETG